MSWRMFQRDNPHPYQHRLFYKSTSLATCSPAAELSLIPSTSTPATTPNLVHRYGAYPNATISPDHQIAPPPVLASSNGSLLKQCPESEDEVTLPSLRLMLRHVSKEDVEWFRSEFWTNLTKINVNYEYNIYGQIPDDICIVLDLLKSYFLEFNFKHPIEDDILIRLLNFFMRLFKSAWLWHDEKGGYASSAIIPCGNETIDKGEMFKVFGRICELATNPLIIVKHPKLVTQLESFLCRQECGFYSEYLLEAFVNLTDRCTVAAYLVEVHGKLLYERWLNVLRNFREAGWHFFETEATFETMARILFNTTKSIIARRKLILVVDLNSFYTLLFWNTSDTFRELITAAMKNCLKEIDFHNEVVEVDSQALASMIYHLIGPENFSSVASSLPLKSKFKNLVKNREHNPTVRYNLLLSLQQLCRKREIRIYMRQKNISDILREYYKWEQDEMCLSVAKFIIIILLLTEEEIGIDTVDDDFSSVAHLI